MGAKLIAGLVAIGLLTTAVLPNRITPKVIDAGGRAASGLFGTVISGSSVGQQS
jgi:hypothetical protein